MNRSIVPVARRIIAVAGISGVVGVGMLLADGTKDATPLVCGRAIVCHNNEPAGGCLSDGQVYPATCDTEPTDACAPLKYDCQRRAAVQTCSSPFPEGRYRIKLDANLDNGHRAAINSRSQDSHHMLQQFDATFNVDESHFFFEQKDSQGCYTMRPNNTSNPIVVLGVLDDNGETYVAEMGAKPNCQAGADQYHWNLIKRDGNRYNIQNKLTGECIHADGPDRQGGSRVKMASCRQTADQMFELEKTP